MWKHVNDYMLFFLTYKRLDSGLQKEFDCEGWFLCDFFKFSPLGCVSLLQR